MSKIDDAILQDARRYRRLRVLGCAPDSTQHLKHGHVMRFTNLDNFLDEDLANYDRGEVKDALLAARASAQEGE